MSLIPKNLGLVKPIWSRTYYFNNDYSSLVERIERYCEREDWKTIARGSKKDYVVIYKSKTKLHIYSNPLYFEKIFPKPNIYAIISDSQIKFEIKADNKWALAFGLVVSLFVTIGHGFEIEVLAVTSAFIAGRIAGPAVLKGEFIQLVKNIMG